MRQVPGLHHSLHRVLSCQVFDPTDDARIEVRLLAGFCHCLHEKERRWRGSAHWSHDVWCWDWMFWDEWGFSAQGLHIKKWPWFDTVIRPSLHVEEPRIIINYYINEIRIIIPITIVSLVVDISSHEWWKEDDRLHSGLAVTSLQVQWVRALVFAGWHWWSRVVRA